MSADCNVSSNTFGPNTRIHQGDFQVIHNYSSHASRKAFFVVPFPSNEDIIRRPEIDTQLDELLLPSKEGRYCSVALWGLGGSGKTQIALDYAYRRSHDDPACDIFWVHANNEASLTKDYQAVARRLGLDPKLNGEELFLEVCDRIESLQRWLLILDNADDVTCFGVGATDHTKSLLRFIPGGPGGTVLWTSRDKQIVALAGPRRGIQIPHMAIDEAENLLSMARGEDIRESEIQDARLLLQELQWLPLAISQAGSFMRRYPTPIKEYLAKLLEGKSRWDTLRQTQYERHRRPDVSNSILETWDISIRHIEQESYNAYNVLITIAYFDSQNIPLSLILAIPAYLDPFEQETPFKNENVLETVIVRLKEFSFISERKTENNFERSFDIHKLVQDAIRYTLNTRDIAREKIFSRIALKVLRHLFPKKVKRDTWPLCEKYATHAIQVSEWAEMLEIPGLGSELLGRVAEYFRTCGFLKKAEYTAKKELGLAKKEVSLVKKELRLTNSHATQSPAVTQVPAIIQQSTITQIPWTTQTYIISQLNIVNAMFRLSSIYRAQELYEEAEAYAINTLALSEKTFGEKHRITIRAMTLVMLAHICQGQYKKAEELQDKQLLLQQGIYGEKHPITIIAMSQLAMIYDLQKLYDKSKELKVKVLAFSNEVSGETHPGTLHVMWSLVKSYRSASQFKEAKELECKLLSLMSDFLEKNPMIDELETLARIYYAQGHLDKAKELRKRILSLQQSSFEEKRLDTAMAMQNLADIHILDKEYKEAEELHLKALAILHETFGEKNEQTILAMMDVARLYYMQNLTKKGEEFRKRAISLTIEMYGNHPPSKFVLQLKDIEGLSKRHSVIRRMSKLLPLMLRRLEERISRIELLKRRLSKQVLLVMLLIKRHLLKQRLLKLAKSIRPLNRRWLNLGLSQGHKLIHRHYLIQSLLKRRVSKLRLLTRSSLARYEIKLRL
ncbi:hypothetical protein GGI35DRAFT_102200 [Trichoderma velutinum]